MKNKLIIWLIALAIFVLVLLIITFDDCSRLDCVPVQKWAFGGKCRCQDSLNNQNISYNANGSLVQDCLDKGCVVIERFGEPSYCLCDNNPKTG